MPKSKDYFSTFCKISKALGTTREKDELLDLIVESAIEAMALMENRAYDVIVTDKNMPDAQGNLDGGMTLLRHAKERSSDTEVIMITGYATVETAVDAMKAGAFDYIMKPIPLEELKEKVDRIIAYRRFMQSENTLGLYRTLHQDLLEKLANRDDLPEAELHQMLRRLGGRLDQVFGLQQQYETIIELQAKALEDIEAMAENLKAAFEAGNPYLELVDRIYATARKRIQT